MYLYFNQGHFSQGKKQSQIKNLLVFPLQIQKKIKKVTRNRNYIIQFQFLGNLKNEYHTADHIEQ